MRFFFDNNLSPKLVEGMRAFGEDVIHLVERFKPDTPDVEWLKVIGEEELVLITRDEAVRRNPTELDTLKRYRVGAFFLGGKGLGAWPLIQQVVRNWPRIKEYAQKTHHPYAFRVPPSGTKFVRLPL